MKKILLLVLTILIGWTSHLQASHLMGGEITWQCVKSGPNTGRFIFTVKLYRDCNGIPGPGSITLNTNAPGFGGGILCNLFTQTDISPVGPGCPTCAAPGGFANAVEEFVYKSAAINITGVPPATGWYFAYSDCCRNGSITNLGATGGGWFTLRALMFPYTGLNTNPCYDSSPQFAERPQLATCTGDTTYYNANAVDEELDSLVYTWANPLDGTTYTTTTNYPFATGYSATSPLPGPFFNAGNVAAVLNPNTGVVFFKSNTPGAFVTVTRVTAYKCNVKVAEIFREIQIALIPGCNLPAIAPWSGTLNTAPDVVDIASNRVSAIIDTVYAGDTVQIDLFAQDFEPLNATLVPQRISLSASGVMFGTNFTSTTGGCPYPPCATITNFAGQPTPLFDTVPPIAPVFPGSFFSYRFKWITDCNHLDKSLGCVTIKSVYNFVFKVYDNFCPSPSVNFNTLTIVVLAPPPVQAARFKCLDVQPNGNVKLTWLPPLDTGKVDTNKFFRAFYVYRSTTGTSGPYTLIDSLKGFKIANYDTVLQYLDITANANLGPVSYYLSTTSGCELLPATISDTMSTIFLNVSQVGTDASLTWTPLESPLHASTTGKYYVWREQPPAGSGNWVLIDSTTSLSYLDPVFVCGDSINYRIEVRDTSVANCVSRSNVTGDSLLSTVPNITSPSLRCVNVLPNGDIQLSWVGSVDTASYFAGYTVYHSTNLAGPYTNIGFVSNYAANTFTHVGANGQNQINYYNLTTTAGCDATNTDESAPVSNTLGSMLLTANNPTAGFANLSWTTLSTPLPPTSTGVYNVYRRIPPTVAWTLIGDTTGNSYQDTIVLCDTIIEYKVEIADGSGCISTSSIDGNNFTSQGDIIANPSLRCLAVQPNGDVQLTWVVAPDPNNFFAGTEIFHSSNPAGPYTKLTTITTATNTWLHAGAGANGAIQYYYLRNLSGCDGVTNNGSTSDTLATMLLSVSNTNLGFADLTWNAMHSPVLTSAPGPYRILRRSTGIGAYVQIATTNALNYSDPISTCNIPYEYRIELDDNAPCTSISSADNDVFTYLGNVINNPTLRCVSVNANGTIALTWENPTPASFTNFNEYEIWRNSGAGFVLIDSVSNNAQTTYTDLTANGNAQAYSYYMVTQSGCTGQITNGTTGNTLSSIYLTTAGVIGQANLNWTALASPLPSTTVNGQYNIFNTYNPAGTLQLIGDTALLVYQHPILDCDTLISHQVTVNDNIGCVSRSNIASNTYTWLGNVVANPDLRCVNVLANGQIELTWIAPAGSSDEFNEYEIWRDNGAGFVRYDSISNFSQTTWTDAFANGNAQSYAYYMLSQSGCTGQVNSPANSTTLSSIYLTTSNTTLGSAILSWTPLPAQPTSAATGYDVWSSYPNGNSLSVISSTSLLTATEVISDCDTTLRHRVSIADASGCVSNSNVDTNTFSWIGNIVSNPDLRCVNVLANGQIELTWIAPAGSSDEFNEYEIWRNNGAGFVRYDSISNFSQTTWTDAFANGNAQSYAYYMLSQSGCTGQVNSPANSTTLSSIYLTTSNTTLGSAILSWTPLPAQPTSAATGYDVWSSYPNGNTLSVISSTSLLTATEAISDCDTTLRHRVSIADASGCVSNSNVDTNTFSWIGNIVSNPDLRCVNVLANGQIELTWVTPAGSSDEFNEYEIWRNNGAGFVRYDSISNFSQTTWTDAFANGNAQSYAYYMLSQSGCTGQVNSPANSTTLSSIYLTTSNTTLGTAILSWTPLPAQPTSAATGYDVWSSYPNGNTLSVISSTSLLTATEAISDCDTTLRHRVSIADASGCVSNSNVDTNTFTYIGNVINHPELRCASVLPNGSVQLTWVNPVPASWTDFNQFNIWRNTGGGFVLIDSVESNTITGYLDNTANGNAGSISYYLQTKSGCNGQTDPSAIGGSAVGNTLSTIFVVVSGGNTTTATLNWNPVSAPLLPTATGSYLIEREYPGGSGNWSNAATVSSTTWTEPLVLCIDSVNYRVSTGDAQGCTSVSNVDGEIFVDHNIPKAPSVRCASVQVNGNVDLSWVVPTDTGQGFANYKIYRATTAGGPYTLISTLTNYNTSTFTDNAINAQTASYYYFLTTQTRCGGETSPGSDTLRTIKTDVLNNSGVAVVSWNPIHNPELATATRSYAVFKEYPLGTWNQIGTTTAPVYQWFDTINVCQAVINYRVETGDAIGCISRSSIDGDLFRDITRPTVAALDTVSLNPLNPSQVSVSWLPSPSGDVVGYIIYQFNGASWDSVGAATGINASYLLDNNPAAEFGPQRYSIAAYDSCGNVSNIGVSHNTLFITAKLDICRGAIDLRWNPYINMVNGVGQYNVYVSQNGGPYTFLASVPGNNVTYSHTTLVNGTNYCYYVQAQGNTNTRTASSNIACEKANLLTLPSFSYLKKATVIDLRRVVVECFVDTAKNPDVSRYKLQRAFDKTGPFTTVAALNYNGQPIITFNDFGARTDQFSYYYRVLTIDSCGNEVLTSNVGRTILLKGQPDFNLVNKMNWNIYEEWLGNVSNYSLFRSVDGIWSPTPIAVVNSGTLDFDDNVADLYRYPTYSGQFCYRIEAYEGPGNTYGFTDTSQSNIFCMVQEPHLFIPSAFTPGGKNPIFKPEFIYIDAKNFYFAVFNRWGQKVYETRNPTDGWDGTYDGKFAPEGTYGYTVRIFGTNGREIEKSGSVTLLR